MKENLEQYKKFKRGEIRFPAHLKPKKELKGKWHENPLIDRITRAPIWIPQILWFSIALVFIWIALFKLDLSMGMIMLLFVGGFVFWTFTEYMTHRFMYHTETNSESFYIFQFKSHGFHHLYPKDDERLALPPVPGLILSSLFFALFYLILGKFAVAFFAGFLIGYDCYITLHYYQHIIKSPKYKPWKKLWSHHKAHHYSDPYAAFGVSTRLWDWVFNTMPIKGKQ